MPSPNPGSIRRVSESFDPTMLARTVIALPLLTQIEAETEARQKFEDQHPEVREKYNAAIFLRAKYPGGPAKAREKVIALLKDAAKIFPREPECFIDPPREDLGGSISLGWLTGAITRMLAGMDAEKPPQAIERIWPTLHDVIIEVNLNFKARAGIVAPFLPPEERPEQFLDARVLAKRLIISAVNEAIARVKEAEADAPPDAHAESQQVDEVKSRLNNQYVFAQLEGRVNVELVAVDEERALKMAEAEAALRNADLPKKSVAKAASKKTAPPVERVKPEDLVGGFRAIHHIWPDFEIRGCITRSISTVKADAAHRSFTALGDGITWAVMDSGLDGTHPHFSKHGNIDLHSTYHADFSAPGAKSPLTDEFGHGTHVAGIIAGGQSEAEGARKEDLRAVSRELSVQPGPAEALKAKPKFETIEAISGMAPKCRLISLKVLDQFGQGKVSNLIAAIGHLQQINGHGRELHIHGVNISLGYPFDPKWFACGRSPLCVEVNRLVKSGVVVVVAAGNTGYGTLQTAEGKSDACLDLTINDPGNAEGAITVGSTHRDMPHVYGVSFFSSKGPTGDGRRKPDLLAPGEKIISCAAGKMRANEDPDEKCRYLETSGTSMAAPHVSGAIAAFLSIRREFIGETDRIKQIFTAAATDLGRDRYFQGAGLVDLMRAIQSV